MLDNLERGHRPAIPEGAAFVEPTCATRMRTTRAGAAASTPSCTSRLCALVAESVATPSATSAPTSTARATCSTRMRATGVERLVFSSTCATYGEPDVSPDRRGHADRGRSTPTAPPSSRWTG